MYAIEHKRPTVVQYSLSKTPVGCLTDAPPDIKKKVIT